AAGLSVAQTAQLAKQRLEGALAARARILGPGARWRGALEAVGGTIVLLIVLWFLRKARRFAIQWIQSQARTRSQQFKLGDLNCVSHCSLAASLLAKIVTQLGMLFLVVIWVIFVLNRFAETQRWAIAARTTLLGILTRFQASALQAIPG